MDNKPTNDWEEIGKTIGAEVQNAVNEIATAFGTAANSASNTVQNNVANSVQQTGRAVASGLGQASRTVIKSFNNAHKAYTASPNAWEIARMRRQKSYDKKAKGATSAGGSFALVAGIMSAVAISALQENGFNGGFFILAVIAAWFAVGSVSGFFKGRRLRRLSNYYAQMGSRTNCAVAELAAASGRNESFVQRDLRKMLSKGMMEGLYLAPDGSRLFASEMAYHLYLAHEKEKTQQPETAQHQDQPQTVEQPQTVLEECRSFAAELHRQNELIDDAAVTEEADKLEAQTKRMCEWLAKHPDQQSRVRRFADYYLPTTLKLLQTYNDVDPHAADSTVAASVQSDITRILHTINAAFQNLSDNLMQDTALNVSAEISAMETMLAQDGLTQGAPFEKKLP